MNSRPSRSTAPYRSRPTTVSTTKAANASVVLKVDSELRMTKPTPLLELTNSATIAPIIAPDTAILRPSKNNGSALGSRTL